LVYYVQPQNNFKDDFVHVSLSTCTLRVAESLGSIWYLGWNMAFKRVVKNIVGEAIQWTGLDAIVHANLPQDRYGILIYHDPRAEVLDQHLRHLRQHYTFLSIDELFSDLTSGGSRKAGPFLVVTIDDGHVGNYALINVFQKHNVRPTIYICSSIVGTARMFWWQHARAKSLGIERLKRLPTHELICFLDSIGFRVDTEWPVRSALSLEQLHELKSVADIQSHTRFHPILTQCLDMECWEEISISKREVEALTGHACKHFAFPNGNYDARAIRFLKEAGFQTARTCDLGWNYHGVDLYRLKGIPVADDASLNWLDVQMTQIPAFIQYSLRGSFNGMYPQF
jgi:peptidoglycan/xylan/chitin deacetylase (PgdA/CDA1 family)